MEKAAIMSDLSETIRDARGGSEEAFTRIVRLFQARVRTYLGRFLPGKGDDIVDDLAQETFITAYRSLSSYTGEAPFDFWLLRIARNRALACLRDEERRHAREGAAVESALAGWVAKRMESDAGEASHHERKLDALRNCLKGLPETSARMVADFYFRGRRSIDIAREMGKKEGAVWVTLLRIRRTLRQCIDLRLGASEVRP